MKANENTYLSLKLSPMFPAEILKQWIHSHKKTHQINKLRIIRRVIIFPVSSKQHVKGKPIVQEKSKLVLHKTFCLEKPRILVAL